MRHILQLEFQLRPFQGCQLLLELVCIDTGSALLVAAVDAFLGASLVLGFQGNLVQALLFLALVVVRLLDIDIAAASGLTLALAIFAGIAHGQQFDDFVITHPFQ
ncbi:hypothetical protein D9M71_356020 [compost metagenome]